MNIEKFYQDLPVRSLMRPRCAKCLSESVAVVYREASVFAGVPIPEYLRLTCICGYYWYENCADHKEEGAL